MTQPRLRNIIEVHVGTKSPTEWDEVEEQQRQAGEDATDWLRDQRRPAWASEEVQWSGAGLRPRWVGEETAGCAAALDPNMFSSSGRLEFDRFVQAAALRGEVAVTVAVCALDIDTARRNVFGPVDTAVPLIGFPGSVSVEHLGRGVVPQLVAALEPFDKDLATRLLNCDAELRWGSLSLVGQTSHGWDGTSYAEPGGRLNPLIVSGLDEPVAAVWVSPGGKQRVYVLPHGTPTDLVLKWLAERALPALAPALMRRAHDPDGLARRYPTAVESELEGQLARLKEDYLARRDLLVSDQHEERSRADPIRWALLYGTGAVLEDAVASVCRDAGFEVVELDEALSSTSSADLLVRRGGRSRLVEVKSSSKAASETTYEALVSHLRRWSASGRESVEGGVLVLNHQVRTEPGGRAARPFTRTEFLAAAEHPIVTTEDLLDAWIRKDWAAVQQMFFPAGQPVLGTHDTTPTAAFPAEGSTPGAGPDGVGARAWPGLPKVRWPWHARGMQN